MKKAGVEEDSFRGKKDETKMEKFRPQLLSLLHPWWDRAVLLLPETGKMTMPGRRFCSSSHHLVEFLYHPTHTAPPKLLVAVELAVWRVYHHVSLELSSIGETKHLCKLNTIPVCTNLQKKSTMNQPYASSCRRRRACAYVRACVRVRACTFSCHSCIA